MRKEYNTKIKDIYHAHQVLDWFKAHDYFGIPFIILPLWVICIFTFATVEFIFRLIIEIPLQILNKIITSILKIIERKP